MRLRYTSDTTGAIKKPSQGIVHVSRLYLHVHVLYACDGFFIVPVVSDVYSCTSASVEQSSLASQALVEGRVEPGTHCLRMRENLWNRASN